MKKFKMDMTIKKPIIIIGAGGHSRVVIDALLLCNENVLGILDNDSNLHGKKILGINVLGDDSYIEKYKTNEIYLVNAIASTSSLTLRKRIYDFFSNKGFHFTKVIHPSAIVSPFAKLSNDIQIFAGAIIQPECIIGVNTIINTKTSIDHNGVIGNHCHIAPGCTLSGTVQIGDCSHLGTGSSVIQNITIGRNVLVGAGSVVLKNISKNAKVYGLFKGL